MRAILLSLLIGSAALTENAWVGQKFMPKQGATYVNENGELPDYKVPLPLIVIAEREEWLDIGPGRVQKSDVVSLSQAVAYYSEYLQANPTSVWAFTCRGVTWEQLKLLDNALRDFSEAIQLDPTFVSAYNSRGLIWETKGDPANAIKDFDAAIAIDPTNPFIFRNRAIAWLAKRDIDKALADYTEAIRLGPTLAETYNGRGFAWNQNRQFEKAIEDYDEAIRLAPKYAAAFNNRGNAWVAKGMFERALSDFTEAIAIDPNYVYAYNNRARLRATCADETVRDGDLAVADATKAIQLSERPSANMIAMLAAAFAERGDFDKAIEWQTKALNLASQKDKSRYSNRLGLYRAHKPYHENPSTK